MKPRRTRSTVAAVAAGGPGRPLRSCVACRRSDEKDRLVRMVADPAGRIRIDDLRREAGRGAYVHPTRVCVEGLVRARGLLGRALRRNVVLSPSAVEALERRIAVAGEPGRVEDRKGNEEP